MRGGTCLGTPRPGLDRVQRAAGRRVATAALRGLQASLCCTACCCEDEDDEEPEYQDESEEEDEDDDLVRADCWLVGGTLIRTGGLHLCLELPASG